jgi:hypothetical protein
VQEGSEEVDGEMLRLLEEDGMLQLIDQLTDVRRKSLSRIASTVLIYLRKLRY